MAHVGFGNAQGLKRDSIMGDIPARGDVPILTLPTSVVAERRAYSTNDLFIGDFYVSQEYSVQARTDSPIPRPGDECQTFVEPQLYLASGDLSEADDSTTLEIISPDVHSNQHPARVHFRSRVRITSGINHHRHRLSTSADSEGLRSSRSSSISGSSSISAPLRSLADEHIGTPGWGTLGQRVSLFAKGKGPLKRQRLRNRREQEFSSVKPRRNLASRCNGSLDDERTPLIRSTYTPLYINSNSSNQDLDDDEEFDYEKEVEMVFGPWPLRLLNHHWWWWKMEPIFCCRHTADSDEEG